MDKDTEIKRLRENARIDRKDLDLRSEGIRRLGATIDRLERDLNQLNNERISLIRIMSQPHCPVCSSLLEIEDGSGVQWQCTNLNCQGIVRFTETAKWSAS